MADYSILFARSARKELEALSNPLIERIFTKIESLAFEPRPSGSRKLQGNSNLWRIRIGDYRVVYSIDDAIEIIEIVRIKHRREVYD
jgi:mRNA interferase RelE/StbE